MHLVLFFNLTLFNSSCGLTKLIAPTSMLIIVDGHYLGTGYLVIVFVFLP